MASDKKELFSNRHRRMAELAKALAHPARIAILEALAQKNSCICGDLVDELPLSQSTVSQHIKALKSAGLIQGEIDGPRICYCIDPAVLDELRMLLGTLAEPKCCP